MNGYSLQVGQESGEQWLRSIAKRPNGTFGSKKQLAKGLERKAERQRRGLEPLPGKDQSLTFGELMDWWWQQFGRRLRSQTIRPFAEKHFRASLGPLPLTSVTAAKIESVLRKPEDLSAESLNHLRAFTHRLFALAQRHGLWTGSNPAGAVPRFKVAKRLPAYLRQEEVPRLLTALDARWRPIFATAIYTGLRRGELLALRKADVDLDAGTIAVCRSHGNATTKGGHADLLPIAEELHPYLRARLGFLSVGVRFSASRWKTPARGPGPAKSPPSRSRQSGNSHGVHPQVQAKKLRLSTTRGQP